MKMRISFIFLLSIILLSSFMLVACFGPKDPPHTHTFETTFSYDKTHHWYEATCGCEEVKDKDTHNYVENVCTQCGYRRNIVNLSYDFSNLNGGYYSVTGITSGTVINEVVIPDTYQGYPVKSISSHAFASKNVHTVVLGNNIETIGSYAFSNNLELSSVTFSECLKYIGEACFKNCSSLEEVSLPSSVEKINKHAFSGTNISSIIIPESIEELKESFYSCSGLSSITFNGVPTTFYGTFENCTTLESITLPEGLTYIGIDTFNGCTNLKNITIPSTVSRIDSRVFKNCRNDIKVHFKGTISDYANIDFDNFEANPLHNGGELLINQTVIKNIDNSVGNIKKYAFYNYDKLETLTCGNYTITIEDRAFYDCDNLKTITMSNSLVSIGESSFYDCDMLETINISSSLQTIGLYAFNSLNNLKQFVVDTENTSLASYDGNLYSKDMTMLYQYAIGKESTSFVLPNSVTEIKKSAFEESVNLTEITLGFVGATLNGTENTHFGYIYGAGTCEENELFVPNTLKKIAIKGSSKLSRNCFYGLKNIEDFNFENILSVESAVFEGCDGITSLEFPNSIVPTKFGKFALQGLNNLENLIVYELEDIEYFYPSTLKSLTIKNGVKIFKKSLYNAKSIETVILPNNLEIIQYETFQDFTNLKSIEIPESVTEIGSGVFQNCDSLTEVTIPDQVTSISSRLFEDCDKLLTVNLPANIFYINYKSFYGCNVLKNINFSNISNLMSIGESAFIFTNITELHLTKNTISIGKYAFDGCALLTDLTLPFVGEDIETLPEEDASVYTTEDFIPEDVENLTILGGTIPFKLFEVGFPSIKTLTIKDDVSQIDSYAFTGLTNLETINFENISFQNVGVSAFNGCENLKKVNVDNIETWLDFNFKSKLSNPLYYAKNLYINNVLVEEITIPEEVTEINSYAFYNCLSLKNLYLHQNFKKVNTKALYGCNNLELTTENNLVYLGTKTNDYFAIYKTVTTNIETCKIHQDTKVIMTDAFEYCNSITEVDVASIEAWCHLNESSNIPVCSNSTLKVNGEEASEIIIPATVTKVTDNTFLNFKNITGLKVLDGVVKLGKNTFKNCNSLKNVEFSSTLEDVEAGCFEGCTKIEKFNVPTLEYLLSINFADTNSNPLSGKQTAYLYINDVKTTEIVVPTTVSTIKSNIFGNVQTLSKITISNKTNTFAKDAFINCPVDVYIDDIETWAGNLFVTIHSNPIYTNGNLYLNGEKVEDIVITKINAISSYAFANCNSLKTFNAEAVKISSVGQYAFYDCDALTSVSLFKFDSNKENAPSTTIGTYAFANSRNLSTLHFGWLTEIGKYAFENCNGVTKDNSSFFLVNTNKGNGRFRLYTTNTSAEFLEGMYSNQNIARLMIEVHCDKKWVWYS